MNNNERNHNYGLHGAEVLDTVITKPRVLSSTIHTPCLVSLLYFPGNNTHTIKKVFACAQYSFEAPLLGQSIVTSFFLFKYTSLLKIREFYASYYNSNTLINIRQTVSGTRGEVVGGAGGGAPRAASTGATPRLPGGRVLGPLGGQYLKA